MLKELFEKFKHTDFYEYFESAFKIVVFIAMVITFIGIVLAPICVALVGGSFWYFLLYILIAPLLAFCMYMYDNWLD